ncbi:MAG: hypothetical protein H0U45_13185 [Tatlockia sp.]|nr:hypothetical protein [Tatlockia sp.]
MIGLLVSRLVTTLSFLIISRLPIVALFAWLQYRPGFEEKSMQSHFTYFTRSRFFSH